MADIKKVFISSTSKDLTKYRAKVKLAVLRAGAFPIAMEEFNATTRNALQRCYDDLQEAEIFIGIYAYRYGFVPGPDLTYKTITDEECAGNGETGITHWEYLWAMERNIPVLLYVVGDKDKNGKPLNWPSKDKEEEPGAARLSAFKTLIKGKHGVGFFYSPDNLAFQVSSALAEELPKLTSKPSTIARTRHDFYKGVELPIHFVPREALITDLRLALLGDSSSVALTADKPKPTALHGMGGIGKSVMARALCDLPEVQAAFPDGILWAVLGQNPSDDEIRVKLRDWVNTLGEQITENVPTLDKLKNTLVEVLENKSCLLIVDDVWRRKQAEWFKVGGRHCRMLITTRDTEVAKALGADVQHIPLMAMDEALALLEKWADGRLATYGQDIKQEIVKKVGRLPLALKLAGAQLQYETPENWLKTFDANRLETDRPEDVHDSL